MTLDKERDPGVTTSLLEEEPVEESSAETGSSPETLRDIEDEIRRAAESLVEDLHAGRKKVVESERRDRVRDERRRILLTTAAVLLSLACVVLTAMNASGTGPFARGAPELSIAEREQLIAGDVVFAVREIEAVIAETGAVPADIAAFDFAVEPGWSYAKLAGDAFVLSLADDGFRASYDSREGFEGLDVRRLR